MFNIGTTSTPNGVNLDLLAADGAWGLGWLFGLWSIQDEQSRRIDDAEQAQPKCDVFSADITPSLEASKEWQNVC